MSQQPDASKSALATAASEQAGYYYKGNQHVRNSFVPSSSMVKLGTLTRAAGPSILSQPTVSLLLQALERELGITLLGAPPPPHQPHRRGRGALRIGATAGGVGKTLDRDFQSQVQGLQGRPPTIAAGTSTIKYLLPDMVRRYREHFPEVQLQLANVTGKDGLALLRADEADFAVGSMLDVPNDIAWAPVYHYDPMLITPPDHPLASKTTDHAGGLCRHPD